MACASVAACVLWAVPAGAVVDDAHSFAMEAATPFVEKGFRVRADYWNGELKLGERKAVKHQLFKGNEYCFWLATDRDDVELKIAIYDAKGNPVKTEIVDSSNAVSARVLPPNTGTYLIVFALVAKDPDAPAADEPAGWALAYGYR